MRLEWTSTGSLGGQLQAAPAAVSKNDGDLDVFAVLADGGMYTQWFNTHDWRWSGWAPLGGQWHQAPAVACKFPGELDLFVTGDDQNLWTSYFNFKDAWSAWASLPAPQPVGTAPGAASGAANQVTVVVGDQRQELSCLTLVGGQGPGAWTYFADGQPFEGAPACTKSVILVRRSNNEVYEKRPVPGGSVPWSPGGSLVWKSIGGRLLSAPAIASREAWNGRVTVFGQWEDGTLYLNSYDGMAWSGWSQVGDKLTSAPAVAAKYDNQIDVFFKGPGGDLICKSAIVEW